MAKKKQYPFFAFYPKDFTTDENVEVMSTPAVGAYILLLCKAWNQKPPATLPNDDPVLARFARMTPDEWQAVRSDVLSAFTVGNDGRLHQKRLRREYEIAVGKSNKASMAAKERWSKVKNADAHADALHSHCDSNAMQSVSVSKSSSDSSGGSAGGGGGSPDAPIPEVLDTPEFRAAWEQWFSYRREYRLTKWKPSTIKTNLKKLAEVGHDAAIESINRAIESTWKGIHPAKAGGKGAGGGGQTPQSRAEARRAEQAAGEFPENLEL